MSRSKTRTYRVVVGDVFTIDFDTALCAEWVLQPSAPIIVQRGKPTYRPLPPQIDRRGDHYLGRAPRTLFSFKARAAGRCIVRAAIYQVTSLTRAMGRENIVVIVTPRPQRRHKEQR